jgi:PAS domain S-box-containing protein
LAQRDLERKEKRYQSLVESLNEGILAIDKEGKTTFVNEQMARMLGYSADELLGKSIYSYMLSNEATHAAEKLFASNTGEYKLNDFQFVKADASLLYVTIEPAPIYNEYGVCTGVMCGVVNITEKKEAELQLKAQAALLQQKNSALKEVLSQIEDEKTRIKQSVALNVEEIILPLISKMKIEGFSDEKMKILVNSLQQITSDFGLKISHKKNRLSPRETEICNLIKQGLSSKEISQLLHISPATTERYRNNIRAKLGIVKKNVNLVTYLNNL